MKNIKAVDDIPEMEVKVPAGDYRIVVTLYELQYNERGSRHGARFEATSRPVHVN
jgi:hypothetical protein